MEKYFSRDRESTTRTILIDEEIREFCGENRDSFFFPFFPFLNDSSVEFNCNEELIENLECVRIWTNSRGIFNKCNYGVNL